MAAFAPRPMSFVPLVKRFPKDVRDVLPPVQGWDCPGADMAGD